MHRRNDRHSISRGFTDDYDRLPTRTLERLDDKIDNGFEDERRSTYHDDIPSRESRMDEPLESSAEGTHSRGDRSKAAKETDRLYNPG